jgi:hypothetical protein
LAVHRVTRNTRLANRNKWTAKKSRAVQAAKITDHPVPRRAALLIAQTSTHESKRHKMKLHKLVITVFAATLLVGWATSAKAVTCSVPSGTYATIQSAVDDPTCDTIEVDPGTYNESVMVARPVTFVGPNSGVSGSGTRGPEATVTSLGTTFNLTNGGSVTIDGFTINGNFGVYVSTSTTGTVIENNIITGTVRALTFDAPGDNGSVIDNQLISDVRSMHLSSGPYNNLKVDGNTFSSSVNGSVFFSGNSSITGFELKNNQMLQYSNFASNITNGVIRGNTFDAPVGSALNTQMSLHNTVVMGNTFNGHDANACFQLFGSQFGLVPSHDVTVSENTFTDCGGSAAPWNFGFQLSPDVYNIVITDNSFSSGFEGINTRDSTAWMVAASIHVNGNNITGNTHFGVRNGQTGALDATCNWWGAANGPGPVGPGSGDKVSANVTFAPWLNAPAPDGKCFPVAKTAAQCKKGGWTMMIRANGTTFKNQGDCIQYVNTGK